MTRRSSIGHELRLAQEVRVALLLLVVATFLQVVQPSFAVGPEGGQQDADERSFERTLTGHLKLQLLGSTFPKDSTFQELIGSESKDLNLDLRLNFAAVNKHFDLAADAQVIGLYGDTVEFIGGLGTGLGEGQVPLPGGRFPEDDRRLFDLTGVNASGESHVVLSRLDRLSIGYTGRKGVLRLGRQAITWGNGFVYTPMDIFNPFDPTAVDKEYKTGDDMLYGQLLRDGGDDLQSVVVFRRDPRTGEVSSEQGSAALKYHGLAGVGEFDLLLAEHYGETLVGLGGNRSIGGAVWRGDLMLARTDEDTTASLVTSMSYSWILGGKNTSGLVEYFYNGFGQPAGRYGASELAANPDLLSRVSRAELFNLGRHYVAASANVELTPLFMVTPNLFVNLEDPSALVQIATQNDLGRNFVLQGALLIPIGSRGTEFGGIETELGSFLSSGASVFLQLAWYY